MILPQKKFQYALAWHILRYEEFKRGETKLKKFQYALAWHILRYLGMPQLSCYNRQVSIRVSVAYLKILSVIES